MLSDLSKRQLALAEYMSSVSEAGYSAGWMRNLEFALWEALLGRRTQYGRLTLNETHLSTLRALSRSCGGWIAFMAHGEETWLSTEDWERRFSLGPPSVGKPDAADAHRVECVCGVVFDVPFAHISLVDVMRTQQPIADSIATLRALRREDQASWMSDLLGAPYTGETTEAAMVDRVVAHHRSALARGTSFTCAACARSGEVPLHPVYTARTAMGRRT